MARRRNIAGALPAGIVSLVLRWLILALAVWVAAELIPGIQLEGAESTLVVAAILGLLNLYLRPLLFLLSMPVTIVTLGVFIVVVNAVLLGLADWLANFIDGVAFDVDGVGSALMGALVISLVSLVLSRFINPDRIAGGMTHSW